MSLRVLNMKTGQNGLLTLEYYLDNRAIDSWPRVGRRVDGKYMDCGDRGDASAAANWRLALLRDSSIKFTIREDMLPKTPIIFAR